VRANVADLNLCQLLINSVLADAKVNIEMISQGASEINVSCVIAARDSLKALRMVHGLLELPLPENETSNGQ
jgi:aspartate kinase